MNTQTDSPEKINIFSSAIFFILLAVFIIIPFMNDTFMRYSPGIAVIGGVIFSLWLGNPFQKKTAKLTHPFLSWSIIGMGCGMNLVKVLNAGLNGVAYTVIGIALAIALGYYLGKKLQLPRDTSLLISTGTAICGGSAIAAVASVLKSKAHDIAAATAVVFILNAVALIIFPPIGHWAGLSESQFGLWAALAIHDTSSVVGASYQYGSTALEVGTTVKLARALWIIPLSLLIAYIISRSEHKHADFSGFMKRFPWFIPGFLLAAALVTYIPPLAAPGAFIKMLAQHLMIITLFLIGTNLNRSKLHELGIRPLIQGICLWIVILTLWLAVIKYIL